MSKRCWIILTFLIGPINFAYSDEVSDQITKINEPLIEWEGEPGVLKEAELFFRDLLSKGSHQIEAYIGLSRVARKKAYQNHNNFVKEGMKLSNEYAMKAVNLGDKSGDAYLQLSRNAMIEEDWEQYDKWISKVKKRDKQDQVTLLNGMALKGKGQYKEAIEIFKEITSPQVTRWIQAGALASIAVCYRNLNNFTESNKYYKKSLSLKDTAWMRGNYSSFLIQFKRYDQAIIEAKKALNIMDYPMGHVILSRAMYEKGGKLFWGQKNYEAAVTYFFKALETDPYNKLAAYGIGSYYQNKATNLSKSWDEHNKNKAEAIKYYMYVLEIDPKQKDAKKQIDIISNWTVK